MSELHLLSSSCRLVAELQCAQVAEVLVEALQQPGASRKVVEVVANKNAPERPPSEWFNNL